MNHETLKMLDQFADGFGWALLGVDLEEAPPEDPDHYWGAYKRGHEAGTAARNTFLTHPQATERASDTITGA